MTPPPSPQTLWGAVAVALVGCVGSLTAAVTTGLSGTAESEIAARAVRDAQQGVVLEALREAQRQNNRTLTRLDGHVAEWTTEMRALRKEIARIGDRR